MIAGGDVRRASDGMVGIHVDEFPEQTALLRWQQHDFDAVERPAAKQWRSEWDRHMRSDWREIAAEREAALGTPRDEQANRQTLEDLNARIEEAELVPDEAATVGAGAPDYALRGHRVPATKGKWRMVSTDVEAAGRDD